MSAPTPIDEDGELLAAELAFGLLEQAHRQAAEARLTGDAPFAEAFDRWQHRAALMALGIDEAPRPSVWSAIEAKLPANDVAPTTTSRASLRLWQASTAIAAAAAVVLAVVATERGPMTPPPAPVIAQAPATAPLVAVLTGAPGTDKGFVTVSYDRGSGRLTSAPSGVDVTGHSAELWVIPAGQSPRSLGVIAAGAPGWTRAPAAAAPALTAGATLAVSVEPIGGSPTGQPTGPVILTGKIAAV